MNITKFELNGVQITGSPQSETLVTEINERPLYKDGKPTGEKDGFSLTSILEKNGYERIKVKLANSPFTQEDIALAGGALRVRYKNLVGKIYRKQNGEYDVSCKADGVEVIK